jgi:hypothetical protein
MPGGLLFGAGSMAPGEGGGGADSGWFREAFPSMFRNFFPARSLSGRDLKNVRSIPSLQNRKTTELA